MLLNPSISLFEVPTIRDPRGNLSFIQNGIVPFTTMHVSIDNMQTTSGALVPITGEIHLEGEHIITGDYQGLIVHDKALKISKSVDSNYIFLYDDPEEVSYSFLLNVDSWKMINITPSDIKVPFPISRVYYLTKIPEGAKRGGHSHFRQHVMITAIRGSFQIHVDDGRRRESILLDSVNNGLLIAPEVWRSMDSFEPGTVVLIVSSTVYDPSDYIYDYELFKRLKERSKR